MYVICIVYVCNLYEYIYIFHIYSHISVYLTMFHQPPPCLGMIDICWHTLDCPRLTVHVDVLT